MATDPKMSYARRYRPLKMSEYVGNQGVKDTLKRYLSSKKPQSILLSGNTGCGKTTIARLIVKEYLCENWTSESGACGVCDSCQSVDEYIKTGSTEMLFDVIEIDNGEKSGKRDIDYVLETIDYPASMGGWKVYIFDEIQAASMSAQSRLLKVLEEPPESVLIIFCTTDPQRMLDTLKNRCQLKLKITKPKMKEIIPLLKDVCLEEGKDYDLEGLRTIVSRSDFVIRDALNNLERVIETRGNATIASVSEEFKEISDKIIFEFFKTYRNKDVLSYINLIYKIKTEYDLSQFLTSIMNFTIRGIYIINGIDVEGLSPDEITLYADLFKSFTVKELSGILSNLKRMRLGDLEMNLISFVYTAFNSEEGTGDAIKEGNYGAQSINISASEITQSDENSFRNRLRGKIEKDKLAKGTSSLSSAFREVNISDMGDLFQLERVRK